MDIFRQRLVMQWRKIHQFRSGLFQQAQILFIIKAKGFIPGYSDPRTLYPIVFHRIRILLFCRFFTAFLLFGLGGSLYSLSSQRFRLFCNLQQLRNVYALP